MDPIRFPIARTLLRALDSTCRAIGTDAEHPERTVLDVSLRTEKGVPSLRFRATDTRISAVYEITDDLDFPAGEVSTLIPRETVETMRRMLRGAKDSQVDLDLAARVCQVVDGASIEWPAVETTFPSVVVPRRFGGVSKFGVVGTLLARVAASFKAAGSATFAIEVGAEDLNSLVCTSEDAPALTIVLGTVEWRKRDDR